MKKAEQSIVIVGLLLVLILVGCTAPVPDGSAADAGAPANDLTIRLAENPWSASAANVAVAKILIEEELGYSVP